MTKDTTLTQDGGFSRAQPSPVARLQEAGSAAKAELKPGTNTAQCSLCQLYFTGVRPFDEHQIWNSDWTEVRCLTPKEMLAGGMTVNVHGVYGGRIRHGK